MYYLKQFSLFIGIKVYSMSNKQVFGVLLSLFMALNTFADDKFKVGDLYYSITSEENKTVKVEAERTGVNNYANLTDCIIPSTIQYNNTTYSVTEIAFNAFNNAANLTSVTIPASVEYVGENESAYTPNESNVFYNALKLNAIVVDPDNKDYTSIDGVLLTKDKKMLISYPTTKSETKYVIPDGVEKIGTYAFNACSFSEIVLPSSLTKLCMAAFYNCSKITTIVCYATTPPAETYGWTFAYTAQELLYVPEEAVETYKSNSLWGDFKDILPIPSSIVILDESNDETPTQLQTLEGQTVDAQLNRSFVADGAWYTLCLPFALTADEVAESFGQCELMKLDHSQKQGEDVLYIHFNTATTVEVGTPYLFRPANTINSPVFKGVTIEANVSTELAPADGLVSMTGTYSPMQVPEGKWYLGPNNTLYQPQGTVNTKGFRAYFTLAKSLGNKVRARVVMNEHITTDFDLVTNDTATVQKIIETGQVYIIRNGVRYNLQGQVIE